MQPLNKGMTLPHNCLWNDHGSVHPDKNKHLLPLKYRSLCSYNVAMRLFGNHFVNS